MFSFQGLKTNHWIVRIQLSLLTVFSAFGFLHSAFGQEVVPIRSSACERILISPESNFQRRNSETLVALLRELHEQNTISAGDLEYFLGELRQGRISNPIEDRTESIVKMVAAEKIDDLIAVSHDLDFIESVIHQLLQTHNGEETIRALVAADVTDLLVKIRTAQDISELLEILDENFVNNSGIDHEYELRLLLVKVADFFQDAIERVNDGNRSDRIRDSDGFENALNKILKLIEFPDWASNKEFQRFYAECIKPVFNKKLLGDLTPFSIVFTRRAFQVWNWMSQPILPAPIIGVASQNSSQTLAQGRPHVMTQNPLPSRTHQK